MVLSIGKYSCLSSSLALLCRRFQRDLYAATELLTDPGRLKDAIIEMRRLHASEAAPEDRPSSGGAAEAAKPLQPDIRCPVQALIR